MFSDSQAESLVSDAHSNLASIPKEPIEEEKKVNNPQETETSKRRFKRPVWETSLNEASEEEYIPADVAKELIEAKSNEAIYTDPKELEAKLTSERQKEAFLQEHHATSDQASQEKVQSEIVADGNEDDESISLEPSGKPKKKKGKKVKKKDLGMIATTYGYVYVAQIALGANPAQTIKAIKEAEAYPGPSLVIAYAPCINHGIKSKGNMANSIAEEKKAVETGYWHLWRFNPELKEEGKNPFVLDSKEPKGTVREFMEGENRYLMLKQAYPDVAEELFTKAEKDLLERYETYKKMAE